MVPLIDLETRSNAAASGALRRLPLAFGIWVCGIQIGEPVAAVGAWLTLLLVAIHGFQRARLSCWRVYGFGVLFVAWSLAAPLAAMRFPTAFGLARWADFLLIPAAAAAVQWLPRRSLERVAVAGCAVFFVSMVVAFCQHIGAWPSLSAFEPLHWLRIGFARVYEASPGESGRYMAGGLLFHRLKFANVGAVVSLLVFASGLSSTGWRRALAVALAVAGIAAIAALAYARAASVATLFAMGILWWGRARARVALVGIVAGATVLAAALASQASVRTRFESALDPGVNAERIALFTAGLRTVVAHPIAGIGLGQFHARDSLPAGAPASAASHQGKAHNQFVTIAAESGIIASLLLLAWLFRLFQLGYASPPAGGLLLGAVALFIALSLLHDPLFHAETSFALMLAIGSGIGALERKSHERPAKEARPTTKAFTPP